MCYIHFFVWGSYVVLTSLPFKINYMQFFYILCLCNIICSFICIIYRIISYRFHFCFVYVSVCLFLYVVAYSCIVSYVSYHMYRIVIVVHLFVCISSSIVSYCCLRCCSSSRCSRCGRYYRCSSSSCF